jgi:2'-5' RNA ligase
VTRSRAPYAVVAFPRFKAADADWVEEIRRQHDPLCSLIPAHFTLVFPARVSAAVVVAAAKRVIAGATSFAVELTRAAAHRDAGASRSHVFLVPSSGGDQIQQLHAALYDGDLRAHLDAEIPYVPHVTVGVKSSHAECVALAETLNRHGLSLQGIIDRIEVVSASTDVVRRREAFILKRR